MNKHFQSHIISSGLAIFSMFFGAGNLMYPIVVGMEAAQNNFIGIAGFLLTAICLPLVGLVSMILFDGNYEAFFNRLGKPVGETAIFLCMLILGPALVIPRIVTLSHTMIAPFIPIDFLQNTNNLLPSLVFSIIFLTITFLATYRESKIMQVLGYVISPALLISLVIIIVKGLITAEHSGVSTQTMSQIFTTNVIRGYETLDLLGAIFFSSVILSILKQSDPKSSIQQRAIIGFKAGAFGVGLLGLVYTGMSYLGVFHAFGLEGSNAGELFREVSFRILGPYGAIIIAAAVLMACLSTAIAISAVLAEYVQHIISHEKVNYIHSLILVMLFSLPLCTFGLGAVLKLTAGPLTYIGYPILIVLTGCNMAYKLFGFKPIKLPVALTLVIASAGYFLM